jgi:conjugative coupling factor TraD (TOL family)
MASQHAVDTLLRPPVELWSASAAAGAAVVAQCAPWSLLMPPAMGTAASLLLAGFAAQRLRQGWRVVRYQRNMKRLPVFLTKAKQVPVSHRKYYLGQGFRWGQIHTQRLRDTRRPEVQRFIDPGSAYRTVRRFENAVEGSRALSKLAALTSSRSWWNPVAPLPALGGDPHIHAVSSHEEPVYTDLSERVAHLVAYGTTRVGKTRLLEIGATQDIHRGDVVIVIDPKGDAELMKRCYAEAWRAGRLENFHLFHLGFPSVSSRYNAIGNFSRITQVATRLTNPLPSAGNSAAFREFCWRFANIIARAISALGRKPVYREVLYSINDIEPLFLEYSRHWLARSGPADWEHELAAIRTRVAGQRSIPRHLEGRSPEAVAVLQFLRRQGIHEPVLEGLSSVFKYDRTYFDKLVSSLGPLLEKLTTGPVADLLSPDYFDISDSRPIFDWQKVIRQGGIVYVGLDALTDAAVAMAVGNSMFADLVSVAGEIYKHGQDRKVCLHLDEFSDLAGDEFVPMANKIGGAGFQLNIYTQTSADLEARLGSRAKAEQVVGNLNTIVMFRVKNVATAEQLTQGLPEVEVAALTAVSGATDASGEGTGVDFVSRNEDRIATQTVPLIAPADVMALPKGQAFALLEGGQLWKVRMPLLDPIGDTHLPASIVDLAERMERSYRTSELWWREADHMASGTTGTWDAAAMDADGQAQVAGEPELAAETTHE